MRFRRELHPEGATVAARVGDRWLPLALALGATVRGAAPYGGRPRLGASADDLVGLLAGGERTRDLICGLAEEVRGLPLGPGAVTLPFAPLTLRCFTGWEQHWTRAAAALAQRYHPLHPGPVISAYEKVTRTTFPPLRPGREFYEHPTYYLGNPLNLYTEGETAPWPSYAADLDLELEFGMLLVHPVLDADERRGEAAIGGLVVFNDLSARDVQWREHSEGLFGPVVKTKGFASAMSAEVVSPDEVLPHLDCLTASVTVDGTLWSTTSTAGMQHSVGDLVAWASRGEQLHLGELLTSGTLPWGSGMEIDRWLTGGDTIRLEIERIGTLTHRVGPRGPGVGLTGASA